LGVGCPPGQVYWVQAVDGKNLEIGRFDEKFVEIILYMGGKFLLRQYLAGLCFTINMGHLFGGKLLAAKGG